MVIALLVVLFAVFVVLVGRLAYKAGWSIGYDVGFDDSRESKTFLLSRIDSLSDQLEAATKLSDEWKRKYQFADLLRAINFAEFEAACKEIDVERKVALEGCGHILNLLGEVARLETEILKLQQRTNEDSDQIDGLTVDLTMAEAERDKAKETIDKITSAKVSAKVAAEIKRIVAAQ